MLMEWDFCLTTERGRHREADDCGFGLENIAQLCVARNQDMKRKELALGTEERRRADLEQENLPKKKNGRKAKITCFTS